MQYIAEIKQQIRFSFRQTPEIFNSKPLLGRRIHYLIFFVEQLRKRDSKGHNKPGQGFNCGLLFSKLYTADIKLLSRRTALNGKNNDEFLYIMQNIGRKRRNVLNL